MMAFFGGKVRKKFGVKGIEYREKWLLPEKKWKNAVESEKISKLPVLNSKLFPNFAPTNSPTV